MKIHSNQTCHAPVMAHSVSVLVLIVISKTFQLSMAMTSQQDMLVFVLH